jgi:hypothetical protein
VVQKNNDIIIIADASLRYKVADQDKYEQLKRNDTYLQATKENPRQLGSRSYGLL